MRLRWSETTSCGAYYRGLVLPSIADEVLHEWLPHF